MKKSELTAFIKEEIKASLANEDTQQDIKDTEELTAAIEKLKKAKEEAGLSEENIGLADLEEMGYEAGVEAFTKVFNAMNFKNSPDFRAYKKGFIQGFTDESGAYGLSETVTEEEEDAPAGDKEIEKKASKQDLIIKNYQKLQRDLKRHLKAYKEAKSEEEKQSHLKDMKKISQSAEYLDAKAKYEKLKQVKV